MTKTMAELLRIACKANKLGDSGSSTVLLKRLLAAGAKGGGIAKKSAALNKQGKKPGKKPAKKKAPAKRRAFRSGKGPPKMKEENCKIWFRYAVERQTIFQYAPAPAHTPASFAPWART